jgi:hypothetical protein
MVGDYMKLATIIAISITLIYNVFPCYGFSVTDSIISDQADETNFQIQDITIGNSTKNQVMAVFGKVKIQQLVKENKYEYIKESACYISSENNDKTGVVFYFENDILTSVTIHNNNSNIPAALSCNHSSIVNKNIQTKSGISLNTSLEANISKAGKVIYNDSNEKLILFSDYVGKETSMILQVVSRFSFIQLKNTVDTIVISRDFRT